MMTTVEREIWFRCQECGRESYCGQEFERIPDAEIMCPFCGLRQKLAPVRLN